MKGGDVERITRKLLPHFPGFAVRRANFFKVPLNGFFVGVVFQASSWDKNCFYINMFCQPLFKPASSLSSFHILRLRSIETNDESWEWNDLDILKKIQSVFERDLLPFSERMSEPLEFIKYAEEQMKSNTYHTLRDIGLTWAWLGEKKKSITTFERLIKLPVDEYGAKWQNALKDEARSVVLLLRDNADVASRQLKKWEEETIFSLKL